MKYIDEFRNRALVKKTAEKIAGIMPIRQINIMEVCGTHTQSFFRFGLDKLLPSNLRFISGPGCPVCVSPAQYIDTAIRLARDKNHLVLTFGDMLRVPGTKLSLEKARAEGAGVGIVYSAFESIRIAQHNPDKKIIFLAVGFETTIPTIALTIKTAQQNNLKNLCFFSALKLIPPAMDYLAQDKRLNISGFLCPGHVSAVIGTKPYEFIPRKYKIPCCITGFEPLDILEGIYFIVEQVLREKPGVANQYMRVVKRNGNPKARKIISEVFTVTDIAWRGLGKVPVSGLKIRDKFSQFDAARMFSLKPESACAVRPQDKCKCGEVLKGIILPPECPLFSKLCKPETPVGPCMVSQEGACNAYYKYRR